MKKQLALRGDRRDVYQRLSGRPVSSVALRTATLGNLTGTTATGGSNNMWGIYGGVAASLVLALLFGRADRRRIKR